MKKSTILTAAAVAAVVILSITTLVSCNGKAKAESLYNTYHEQAEATIAAKALVIDQQCTTIHNDSLAIAGYKADMVQVSALTEAADHSLQLLDAIAKKHSGN